MDVKMTKNQVTDALRNVVEQIEYKPIDLSDTAAKLRTKFTNLHGLRLVATLVPDDLAIHVADEVFDRIIKLAPREKVRIGFGGGKVLEVAMRLLARRLAEAYRNEEPNLPRNPVFGGLLAGTNPKPYEGANAGLRFFLEHDELKDRVHYEIIPAPPIVRRKHHRELRENVHGIAKLFTHEQPQGAPEEVFDIVVTSCGAFCGHSFLEGLYGDPEQKDDLARITGAKDFIGDLMWHPMSSKGHLELDLDFLPVTRLHVNHLRKMVSSGKHVILVAGRCRKCREFKHPIIKTASRMGFVNVVITDVLTGSNLLESISPR